ncbi:glyoxalase [Croceicoccus estronivorus]|uniref:VOC family protein n=1 Tax=Croceicoccus estronivorus TaxID=1172626 RepID=UPI00083392B3|nr:VOC family protein [Croceicoccus estronivorus]OCC22651.1 glyoxalase [Croceicoccus estronivorus]
MANPVGGFIWYELMTTDADGAAAFYGSVVGWTISGDGPSPEGIDYRHITRSDGGSNGGVLHLTPEMCDEGARPCWVGYLHVADVDSAVDAILADGGRLLMPKATIDVGSFALVTDPQGTPFYVMTPVPPPGKPDAVSDVFSVTEPQHVRWNELASPDQAGAMAFYARHFGFEFNEKMSMGPMGDYCFIGHNGITLGAIMQQQDKTQPALWQFYIGVPSIADAKRAVEANGGTVLMGPHEVPGGDWIIVGTDPQGVVFGLVGPKGE